MPAPLSTVTGVARSMGGAVSEGDGDAEGEGVGSSAGSSVGTPVTIVWVMVGVGTEPSGGRPSPPDCFHRYQETPHARPPARTNTMKGAAILAPMPPLRRCTPTGPPAWAR